MYSYSFSKDRVLMISLNYPRPSNPAFGAWFENQIGAYAEYSDISLCVPVHITPSITSIRQATGITGKLRSIKTQLMDSFQKLPPFTSPVMGRYVRFASIPPKHIFPYSGGVILAFRLFFQMIGNRKPNVIHGQSIFPEGLAAVLLGMIFNRPSVVTPIGSDIHSMWKGSVTYKSTLFVLYKATLITTVSSELKQRIVGMGIDESKIIVVPNGVDPDFQQKCDVVNVRQRMNIPEDAKVIGFVGRLIPVKDPLTLLKAFGQLLKERKNVFLIFVGDGELKETLLQEASKSGISNQIRFSDGMVAPREIPNYMQAFDFLCLSSIGEGWPNVILEAMVCGKPVIGTNVGGVPEAIASEDYGFIVPPQDPAAMADAMRRALDSPWNRKDIAQYARENSWQKVGLRYHEIYQELHSKHNQ